MYTFRLCSVTRRNELYGVDGLAARSIQTCTLPLSAVEVSHSHTFGRDWHHSFTRWQLARDLWALRDRGMRTWIKVLCYGKRDESISVSLLFFSPLQLMASIKTAALSSYNAWLFFLSLWFLWTKKRRKNCKHFKTETKREEWKFEFAGTLRVCVHTHTIVSEMAWEWWWW